MIKHELDNSSLKQHLIDTLPDFPAIGERMGDLLLRRMEDEDWLYCPLSMILLFNSGIAADLERRLSELRPKFRDTVDAVFREVGDSGVALDRRMDDALTEIRALEWLISQDYQKVHKTVRPDFEFETSSGKGYAEVKNLRTPSSLVERLVDEIHVLLLRNPSLEAVGLELFVDEPLDTMEYWDNKTQLLTDFVARLHRSMMRNEHELRVEMEPQAGERVSIRAKLHPDKRQLLLFHSNGLYQMSNAERRQTNMRGLVNKALFHFSKGIDQLMRPEPARQCERVLLFNWQVPACFDLDNSACSDFRTIVEHLHTIAKKIRDDLTVKVM